jgi:peptide/nickel transport system permease protein
VLRFLLSRARQAAIVVVGVSTLVFVLARVAPGDPFTAFDDPLQTQDDRARLRATWGYDLPLWQQYGRWLGNFARGDFGWSHARSRPVADVLRDAVPNTLVLTVPAFVIGLLAGVALGTWQAARRGRQTERVASAATLTLISVPDFVVALGALTLFTIQWRLAPGSGMIDPIMHDSMSPIGRVGDVLAHLVLPCTTLIVLVAASVSRYQRAAVIGVMHEEFLRTARAKGASDLRVIARHAVRGSLGPVIAIAGLMLPALFGGAVFIETIFGWPGIGRALVEGVGSRDYALVQAAVVIGTILVVLAATLADIVAAMVNPRLRLVP